MSIGINPTEVVLAADVAEGKSPHRLGECCWHVQSGGANYCYKWVQYAEGSAAVDAVALEACYYYLVDGYENHQVTSDLSDSTQMGAGIIQAVMSEGDQGWVQIKGPATLSIAFTAAVDGEPLTPVGATDGTLDAASVTTSHICGVATDASANKMICDFPF